MFGLRNKIQSGKLRDQLPTRAQALLAEQYGVSDMTVGKAIQILKDEGLIQTVGGLGMFVIDQSA